MRGYYVKNLFSLRMIFLIWGRSWDLPLLNYFEPILITNSDPNFVMRHDVSLGPLQIAPNCSLKIILIDIDLVIMVELPCVNAELRLILFVRYAVLFSWPKHKLRTFQEVLHSVFKLWDQSLFINDVEVDNLIGCHLNSNIATDKVYLPPHVFERVVFGPFACLWWNLEKLYRWRRSCDQSFLKEQIHVAHILICDLLKFEFTKIIWVNSHALSLAVKSVTFFSLIRVKRFDWEVPDCWVNFFIVDLGDKLFLMNLWNYLFQLVIVFEMIMLSVESVIKLNVNTLPWRESDGNHWFVKVRNWQWFLIDV